MAGDKLYYGFTSRHLEISLHKPEPRTTTKVERFNKEQVKRFLKFFVKLLVTS
jgi:hypothetical protein